MIFPKTIAALGAGCLVLFGAVALAQTGGQGQRPDAGSQALVLEELAHLDWIEKSSVAALREGVIERMELQIGMPVKKNGVIGVLHHEIAELTVKTNQLSKPGPSPQKKRHELRRKLPFLWWLETPG